ncbi:glycoside hydrolase family 18 protein [Sporobolomyces koalae]|uniref:glycoside hydrolase family 18 protein n=1 Tax=Sporobolomyces koalae TaxID=500713 RepID=UPI00317DE7AC
MTVIACVVALVVIVLCGGGYYLYTQDGGSLLGSSSASSASSGETSGTSGGGSGSGSGSGSGTGSGSGSSMGGPASKSSGDTSATGTAGKDTAGTKDGSASSTGTSSAPASSSSGAGGGGGGGGGGKVTAFFENWVGDDPAKADFSGLYAAFWFCAVPEAGGSITLGESTTGQAKTFAEAAQKGGAKAILTVGGWTGSALFSGLVAKEDTRKAFVDAMVKAMNDNSFDGIDIDWEYPGQAGDTQDFDVKNDLANLLLLLQEIREKIGNDKLISMDTSSGVYLASDGTPSKDMSEFGKVLDFITIMTYDSVTYSSKTTGPNFAFSSKCAPATGSFEIPTTVQAWIDAKFPAEKISVGLASYGQVFQAAALRFTVPALEADTKIQVADFKDGGGVDGYLGKMDYTYDNCTSTPFLYSKDTSLFVAYDDEKSFGVKGGYAKTKGLFGCSVYAGLTQDADRKLIKAALDAC